MQELQNIKPEAFSGPACCCDVAYRSQAFSPNAERQTPNAFLDAAYNLARWIVRHDQDAQDIVQEWFTTYRRQVTSAAALVVLSCALAWSWLGLSSSKENGLIAEAISNQCRSLMVSHLVDCASSDQHTVRPWFNGKLDYAPPVPD